MKLICTYLILYPNLEGKVKAIDMTYKPQIDNQDGSEFVRD